MMTGLERAASRSPAGRSASPAPRSTTRCATPRSASFGVPIWQHQSIGNYLADMATKIAAARQLSLHAAECIDSGERADLEAGMAKLFASEMAREGRRWTPSAIHGGYGYSTEFDVERYYRDAPLMIVGEGTNEIQRNVIVRQLMARADRTT